KASKRPIQTTLTMTGPSIFGRAHEGVQHVRLREDVLKEAMGKAARRREAGGIVGKFARKWLRVPLRPKTKIEWCHEKGGRSAHRQRLTRQLHRTGFGVRHRQGNEGSPAVLDSRKPACGCR